MQPTGAARSCRTTRDVRVSVSRDALVRLKASCDTGAVPFRSSVSLDHVFCLLPRAPAEVRGSAPPARSAAPGGARPARDARDGRA